MKPKNQRMMLILLAFFAMTGAALLAMWGLRERASYFYTPSDLVSGNVSGKAADSGDRTVRLGGMVQKGSLRREPDGISVRFVVVDGEAALPVSYRGILPDLFREGSGVVAEGRLSGSSFAADTILAKHDERYMPPQMGNQKAEHRVAATVVK